MGKQADLQVTTNLIPLPANGGDIAAEAFVEMMSDSSEFLTEGTEAGKKIALFSDGEGDWDRAVVCVVAWLVRSMSLEEALGTMKTQIPDYYMSSPYHSMLKRLAKKPAPKNDKALPKKSQATLPKKVEPKKGESFFIECPSCSLMLEITNVRCGTFRCGSYKKNGRPLPPHSSQMVCEDAVSKGLIYGCGMPFKYNGIDLPVALDWKDSKSWNAGGKGKGGKGGGPKHGAAGKDRGPQA